jgi:hypothetical protein
VEDGEVGGLLMLIKIESEKDEYGEPTGVNKVIVEDRNTSGTSGLLGTSIELRSVSYMLVVWPELESLTRAAKTAAESLRLMGTPHSMLEDALARMPREL